MPGLGLGFASSLLPSALAAGAAAPSAPLSAPPGSDFFALPADALRDAFERAYDRDGAAIFAYHHPEGDHRLRELLAERLARRGAKISGSQVVTTTGCTQALQVMLSILIQPGDIVACEAPAYYGMLELLSEAGAQVLPIPVAGADGIVSGIGD